MRRVLRSASAAVRSRTPSKRSRRRPLWTRPVSMVSGPTGAGSVVRTAPGPSLRSGSSVRTSTVTSPLMPWARPMRATTNCTFWDLLSYDYGPGTALWPSPARAGAAFASADVVHVDEVDTDTAAADGAHDGAQSACGAAVAADHLAEVLRVDPDLEHTSTTQVARGDLHIVRIVDDALHEVLESLLEHAQASVDADSAAASSFFSAFFFWVMASPLPSSSPPRASNDGRAFFGSATSSGAGAGSPLNFCQS